MNVYGAWMQPLGGWSDQRIPGIRSTSRLLQNAVPPSTSMYLYLAKHKQAWYSSRPSSFGQATTPTKRKLSPFTSLYSQSAQISQNQIRELRRRLIVDAEGCAAHSEKHIPIVEKPSVISKNLFYIHLHYHWDHSLATSKNHPQIMKINFCMRYDITT